MPKTANYSDHDVEIIKGHYMGVVDAGEDRRDEVVDELAEMLGRKRRSIIAKLSSLKIYKAKTPAAKDGEPAERKEAVADSLRVLTGLPLVSAENLTKVDLKALRQYIGTCHAEIKELDPDFPG